MIKKLGQNWRLWKCFRIVASPGLRALVAAFFWFLLQNTRFSTCQTQSPEWDIIGNFKLKISEGNEWDRCHQFLAWAWFSAERGLAKRAQRKMIFGADSVDFPPTTPSGRTSPSVSRVIDPRKLILISHTYLPNKSIHKSFYKHFSQASIISCFIMFELGEVSNKN